MLNISVEILYLVIILYYEAYTPYLLVKLPYGKSELIK